MANPTLDNGDLANVTVAAKTLSDGSQVELVELVTAVEGGAKKDLAKAVDAAFAAGDLGLMLVGIRKDAAAALATADGKYQPAIFDSLGQLYVKADVPAADVTSDSVAAALGARATPPVDMVALSPLKKISASSTNATSVKASAGQLYWLHVINLNAAVRYLKLYNKASAPTVGTDTPVHTFPIPASTAAGGFVLALPVPITFSTGIALALTTGAADSDTGAVAAAEIFVNGGYA